MAKLSSVPMPTLEEQLESANERIEELENQLDDSDDHGDPLRDQLDSLCVALESGRPSVPQTPDQWRRCLAEIGQGNDWENGTWR